MSDEPTPDQPTSGLKGSPRRWVRALAAVLLLATVALASLWFGTPPGVPDGPIRLVRDEQGRLVSVDGTERPGFRFEVQAAKIDAQNNFSAFHSSTRSEQPRFACRRLAIFNLSDHLLIERTGGLLLDHLKQLGYVEQIDYYPAGHSTEVGQLAPDIIITLDMDRIAESGLIGQTLEADIVVSAGSDFAKGNTSYSDGLGPPVVEFRWRGNLQHRSTTSGVSSSAAKFKLAAENIASHVGDSLNKLFDEYYEKDGPLPKMPEIFYPAYREPPPMPWLETHGARQVTSYHGLTTHNDTVWRFTTDRDPAEVFFDIHEQLDGAGWKSNSDIAERESVKYQRMSRGAAVVEIFVDDPHTSASIPTVAEDDLQSPTLFYVHYRDRMTRDELAEAIDRAFDTGAPVDTLILFQNNWTKPQRRRAIQMFEDNQPKKADSWLVVARAYHDLEENDKALVALAKAKAMLRTVAQWNELNKKIEKLAEELGDEELIDQPLDVELLGELGFIEITPGVDVLPIELALDEPAHFFAHDADGRLKTVSVRVIRVASKDGDTPYGMAHVDSMKSMRSWGSGGMGHYTQVDGICRLNFSISQIEGKDRFILTTEVTPIRQ